MNDVFLSTLSRAMNRYLHLDPESASRLKKLAGHRLAVELLPFHAVFHCYFTESGVQLESNPTEEASTSLRGTPLQLLNVMLAKEHRQRFFADDVTITGNTEVGQHAIELFDALQIDWEEQLAKLTGDVPAHHAGKLLKRASQWFKQLENSFTHNVSEYVQEEKNWLPSREALQDFFHDIDTLRMDTDRVEAVMRQVTALANQDEEHP